ncbi:hypothetical protein [Thermococcus piezophilus]|uniref:hypothetical protein n=1 Tax=Thermococcus piezophilus TaxID=1712654 RepID=UPI000A8F7C2C|nr:hypothetical protein [Thermococcus piezophilus]
MEFGLERMQVFFPASLERQEELLKAGFKVPYDKESGIRTPLPVASDFSRGRKIRKSRLLMAKEFPGDGKFVELPPERSILGVGVNEKGFVRMTVKPLEYHLEDMGFVSVPPRVWGM